MSLLGIPILGDILDSTIDSGLLDNMPIVGTASRIVSGINNRQEQREATDRAYEFNSQEAQKQRDWLEGMWNKNNLYNSPAHQLQLMKEAGLNPNQFQTSVSPASLVSGGSSASAPSSVPQTPSQAGISHALNDAQIALAESEIKKASADAEKTNQEARHLKGLNDAYEETLPNGFYFIDPNSGNISSVSTGDRTWYQEQRDKSNKELEGLEYQNRKHAFSEHDMRIMSSILRQTQDVLVDMKSKELDSLRQDIREKSLNNSILSDEVQMLQKYGISSKDNNAFTALLRAAARDPENVGRLIGLLSDVLKSGRISLTDFFKNFYNEVGNLK